MVPVRQQRARESFVHRASRRRAIVRGALTPTHRAHLRTQVENVKRRVSLQGAAAGGKTPGRKTPGGSRRSSIFGWSQQSKADPRPLTDKQYLNGCIRNIITYLSTHGYEYPVSPKTLMTPTSKDFVHMVTFLFRKVHPSLKIVNKMEEEVPQIFKKLRYPFPISRSALYAVGSPISWPNLLAALTWLVELLNYEERAREHRPAATLDAPATKPGAANGSAASLCDDATGVFFDFCAKSYERFLAGDDESCASLERDLGDRFAQRDAATTEENARLTDANAAARDQVAAMTSGPSPLESLESKREDLEGDITKFTELVSKLKEHRAAVNDKQRDKDAEVVRLQAELATLEAAVESLRTQVERQAVNQEDVASMAEERTHLESLLASLGDQRASLLAAAEEDEARIARKAEELSSLATIYHAAADRLELVPSTAKHADGVDYTITIDATAALPSAILAGKADLKTKLKPALTALKENYNGKARSVMEELVVLQERLDASEEAVGEKAEENGVVVGANQKLEREIAALRERTEAEVAEKNAAVERLEREIQHLRSASVSAAQDSEQRAQALRNEYEDMHRSFALETEMVNKELAAALETLITHKLHVQQTLKRIDEQTKNYLEDVIVLGGGGGKGGMGGD